MPRARPTAAALAASLLLLIAAALLAAGCGGSDESTSTSTVTESTSSTHSGDGGGGSKGSGGNGGNRGANSGADAKAPDSTKLSAELDQLGEQLGAQVGATIGAPGAPPLVLGSLQSGSAWSTIKVPIALQVIDEAGGVAGLTADQSANITAAITQSDNDAAAALFQDLVASHGSVESASQAVTDLLREAGDEKTVVSTQGREDFSTYGQTDWSLQAQQTFMGALLNGCIGDSSGREFVLAQMSSVTEDTWGLGSAGVPALWKGGWGPGIDGKYLDRQMGQVTIDGTNYAVTIAAIPDDGSFQSGTSAATQIAQWLVDHAPPPEKPAGC